MRVNTRRPYKQTGSSGLGPILLLSMLAGALGLFFVVVKMTESSKAAVSPKDAQVTAPTVSQEIKKSRRQAASSKKKDIAAPAAHVPSLESLESPESNGSSAIRTAVPSSETDQNALVLNVKADSTPVFQSNSANSTLVTSLKKGDEVRSGGLEIIDSQAAWTLVRGRGRSGFVRSESLERKTPTEEARK
jgi:hypothetical protein